MADQGPSPRVVQSVNSWTCLVLASSTNIFMIWLIKNKANGRALRQWRWIIMQTCIFDLFYTVTSFVTQPIFLFEPSTGNRIIVLNGPAGNFPPSIPAAARFTLYYVHYSCSILIVAGIAAQFLYRYLAICRGIWMSLPAYFSILSGILLWTVAYAYVCLLAEYVPVGLAQFVQDPGTIRILNGPSADIGENIAVAVSRRKNVSSTALFWQSVLDNAQYFTQLVPFSVTCFCAWRIRCHIKKELRQAQSNRQHEINRQLTIALLAQIRENALIPAVIFIFYTFILANVFGQNPAMIQTVKMYSQIPNSWLPVWNPLVTIATIRTFRRFVFNKFIGHSSLVEPTGPQQAETFGAVKLAWKTTK